MVPLPFPSHNHIPQARAVSGHRSHSEAKAIHDTESKKIAPRGSRSSGSYSRGKSLYRGSSESIVSDNNRALPEFEQRLQSKAPIQSLPRLLRPTALRRVDRLSIDPTVALEEG